MCVKSTSCHGMLRVCMGSRCGSIPASVTGNGRRREASRVKLDYKV